MRSHTCADYHVKNAASAVKVLAVMQSEQASPKLNLISVSAAWTRLAPLQSAEMTKSPQLMMFVKLTHSFLEKPAENMITAQGIANSIWAVAKLATANDDSEGLLSLLTALSIRAPSVMPEMIAQHGFNVIWAVAKLVTHGIECKACLGVLPALAKRVPSMISHMTTQAVSNAICATGQLSVNPSHASMSRSLSEMLPSLEVRASMLLPKFDPQAVANSCWGLALSN